MAQFVVNVPDAVVPRVVEAFAVAYGYSETVGEGANPETKVQFARRMVKEYVGQVVAGYESNLAAQTAREDSATEVKGSLGIT